MNKHHVLVVSQHAQRYSELIAAQNLPDLSFDVCDHPDPDRCKGADILFGAPDRLVSVLPHCEALRWVQSSWAGVKPLVDQPRRDFLLTGVKGLFDRPMTEFVLAWLLAFERKVLQRSHAHSWDAAADGHLYGKSIGIMGTGSIGSQLAATCKALGLRVRGLNSDGRSLPQFDRCFAVAELGQFASKLDYLVALLPHTPATNKLISASLLAALNPGAILINGGRANVIDQDALVNALATGQLGHAVLDVLELEPLPDSDPLWQVRNLHITSHTAAVTIPESIVDIFCENYRRYHAGRPLLHPIDFEKGY